MPQLMLQSFAIHVKLTIERLVLSQHADERADNDIVAYAICLSAA
jgi:hypothetical protein